MGGDLEQWYELVGGGLEAGVAGARVGCGAAVPAVLDGKRAARLRLDGLRRFDFAGGGANDDVGEKITAFHRGLGVEELYTLDARGRSVGRCSGL